MIVTTPPPFGCPACGNALHYSSDFSQSLCTECGWIPGEPYVFKAHAVSLSEYLTIASVTILQYTLKIIDYETYRTALMDEVTIK